MPSSLHLLALTLLPGCWEVGHRLLGQPLLLAVLTHPRGHWARMEKGILCCLLHPKLPALGETGVGAIDIG